MNKFLPSMLFAVTLLFYPGKTVLGQELNLANIKAKPTIHTDGIISRTVVGYTPAQISAAYEFFNLPDGGLGQTIAIVDAYGSPTIQEDLNVFSTKFGIGATTIEIDYAQGVSKTPPVPVGSGWGLETSLDVEWAHALAPNAAIILVVTKSDSMADLLGGVDEAVTLGATVVSMSWGSAEFKGIRTLDYHFNVPGVAFTAGAGDSGSAVNYPAVSPYVVGVGGTSLYLTTQGSVEGEVSWAGSGGGFSKYEPVPGYQIGFNFRTGRGVPDVAWDANPSTGVAVYVSGDLNAGWIKVGGTSVGAPCWAALIAVANSEQFGTDTFAAETLTTIYDAADQDYPYFFHDITLGNNGGFSAHKNYDFVTGLGTPFAENVGLDIGEF